MPPAFRKHFVHCFRLEIRSLKKRWSSGFLPTMAVAGLLISIALAWTVDGPWVHWAERHIHEGPRDQPGPVLEACGFLRVAGDFYFTLAILLVLLICWSFKRSALLMRLIVAVTCSACLTTAVSRTTKIAIGRVRPRTMVKAGASPWHLEGPTLRSGYDSFPSGHASFAAAGSGPLLLAVPGAGLPLTFATLVIGGSRMIGNYHYPSDVFAGLWLGFTLGCASGRRLQLLLMRSQRGGTRGGERRRLPRPLAGEAAPLA